MLKLPDLVSWVARVMKRQLDAEANQQALPATANTVAAWTYAKTAAIRAIATIEWVLHELDHSDSSQAQHQLWLGALGLLLDVVGLLQADFLPDEQLDMQDVFLHGLEPICHAWLTGPSKTPVLIPFLQRLATDKKLLGSPDAPPPSAYAWKQQSSAVIQLGHIVGKEMTVQHIPTTSDVICTMICLCMRRESLVACMRTTRRMGFRV